jgi:hypothetical protein
LCSLITFLVLGGLRACALALKDQWVYGLALKDQWVYGLALKDQWVYGSVPKGQWVRSLALLQVLQSVALGVCGRFSYFRLALRVRPP